MNLKFMSDEELGFLTTEINRLIRIRKDISEARSSIHAKLVKANEKHTTESSSENPDIRIMNSLKKEISSLNMRYDMGERELRRLERKLIAVNVILTDGDT